ncbi:hypothetical protein [Aliiroseovarius crassostreae]|uniref:hypothetical protein n=1 Tax=Aliiroseovarius crassostreae TaxID=154981 RepID=UPI0011133B3F|nr:hypothetical protein [Aliiroseovarius crassostreae]
MKPGKFHRQFYDGVLGQALKTDGEFAAQITDPMRGAGAGRGGGRFVTLEGAVCLAVFFRLLTGGVPSDRALRIARAFILMDELMDEIGNGLRAFNATMPRPAGQVFDGSQDTFLVTVAGVLPADAQDAIAFVPGCDLTAFQIMEWLDFHESGCAPLCLVNLSELIQQMRDGLEADPVAAVQHPGAGYAATGDASSAITDPVPAFLAEFTIRDPSARMSSLEFQRVFHAWLSDWQAAARPHHQGDANSNAVNLANALAACGGRKVKSNGKMAFAGIRWSKTPAAQAFLTGLLELN